MAGLHVSESFRRAILLELLFLRPCQHIAQRLAVLAQDCGLREQLGNAARRRALGFSWDETMASILRYYRSHLGAVAS